MYTLNEYFEETKRKGKIILHDAESNEEIGQYTCKEDIPEEYLECLVMDQKPYYNEMHIDIAA